MQWLIYRSRALIAHRSPETAALYLAAAKRNLGFGLTGCLHRDGPWFLQYLEGPREALSAVFASIRRDRRHQSVTLLGRRTCPFRRLPGWSMVLTDPEILSSASWAEVEISEMTCDAAIDFLVAVFARLEREGDGSFASQRPAVMAHEPDRGAGPRPGLWPSGRGPQG